MKIVPQAAIFNSNKAEYHYYLEYKLQANIDVAQLRVALGKIVDSNGAQQVIAFGKSCWQLLQPEWAPKQLQDFSALQGAQGFSCPSTQADIFIWLHSDGLNGHSFNFDKMLRISKTFAEIANLQLELMGFKYHDSRDLTGFVDGSANPKEDARFLVALIPESEIGAGGSYLLTQKWIHNLNAFNQQTLAQQEATIGRTKNESIELAGDAMPDNSHVSRTDVSLDGIAQKVYRRSAPFGDSQAQGLYFVSFSCEQSRHQIQLERMFGLTNDGVHDRLIEFSQAVTSSYWFAPSQKDLKQVMSA